MTLKINNKKFDFFNSFSLQLRYNSVGSAFSFVAYFNPDNTEHKQLLKPLRYARCIVEHEGETLITGTLLNNSFKSAPVKQLVSISGYSVTGVLEDCETFEPLQSNGLTLKEVAEKLLKPFNISMVIADAVKAKMDETFTVTTANEKQSVKSYLTELAAQKNIIISHTAGGSLLLTVANASQKPLIHFDGSIPGTELSLSINGQAMHSIIKVVAQADTETANTAENTVTNPFVPVYRPKLVVQSSGTDNDTEQAAKNVRADELKNIKLTITTDRWMIDGKVIKPNMVISVTDPELFLYKKTNWFVESVKLDGDSSKTTAVLECVLPEVYNGNEPHNIFN